MGCWRASPHPPYDNPATRAAGFGEWLGWRPRWDNQCLDFDHWTLYPSYFISPFTVNETDAHITLQMPAMFHSSSTNTTWADAAAGLYNQNWYTTGDQMCNVLHKCDVHLRPLWEMNGNWYEWSAALNLTAFISYFKHIATTFHSVPHGQFKVIWNPNALYQHGTPNTLNPPWLAYPGDEFVDYIALDLYDQDWAVYAPGWSSNLTQPQIEAVWKSQWTAYQKGLYGLDDFLAFAIQHNKSLAVAEWGLKPIDSHGGGDNVIYVQSMYDWLTSPSVYPHILYQSWYDEEDSTISRAPLNPNNTAFPNSAKLYKALFGPSNPFWSSPAAQRD